MNIMKKSNLTFLDGFMGKEAKEAKEKGAKMMVFDWDKAAAIIKTFAAHKDLICEAGLQGDWGYTGGIIFENGKPTNDSYTYLNSNWAKPTLILEWDGEEKEALDCFTIKKTRFTSSSKWDEKSLKILGIKL